MVPPLGIEPSSSVLQTGAMTTSAKAAKICKYYFKEYAMRTMTMAFLFCLLSSIANAQPFESRKPVLCDDAQTLIKSLTENYDEKPIWTARNPVDETRFGLFVNSKTKSWTLLQMTPKIACIIGVGEDSKIILGNEV